MTRTDRLFVDVHILQTVPPSCVNRDDTGSPKTAIYGGAVRARVSSQAWKHAVREMFRDIFTYDQLGERTKRIVEKVADKIKEIKPDDGAMDMAEAALKNADLKIKNANIGTDALFFMSDRQAEAIAKLAADGVTDKKKLQAALKSEPSVDMAMFGRMVADDPSMNFDAAVQVAHAISTHAVRNEYDYFTAVDDRAPEDNAGAAHLGTVEFNSSTLYRYATINVRELKKQLNDGAPDALRGFLEAFIKSMPTGKQNTFANRTVPDIVYVSIRRDQPVNLSGAFEMQVRPDKNGGYAGPSALRLGSFVGTIYGKIVDAPEKAFLTSRFADNPTIDALGDKVSIEEMLDNVKTYAAERLSEIGAK